MIEKCFSFDAPLLGLSLNSVCSRSRTYRDWFRCSFIGAFSKWIKKAFALLISPLRFDAPYLELSLNTIRNTNSGSEHNRFDAPSLELSLNKVVRLFSLCIGIACFDAPLLELSLNLNNNTHILYSLYSIIVSILLHWSFL